MGGGSWVLGSGENPKRPFKHVTRLIWAEGFGGFSFGSLLFNELRGLWTVEGGLG